ncbi:MAG: response regulator transcription factor [Burkholderiales bacterium]
MISASDPLAAQPTPSAARLAPGAPGPVKILVIDDHPLILEALRHVLAQLATAPQVFDADSAEAGRRLIDEHPDAGLALLDLTLPGADGFALLADFRAAHPAVPVVVLSASERHVDVLRALDMGAMGYIPKRSPNSVMLQALRLVLSGGIYVPAAAIGAEPAAGRALPAPTPARTTPRELGLTDRQADVLGCILQGLPNKLICRRLALAEGTVKIHVAAILRALNVHNRTQAVIEASRLGITLDRLPRRDALTAARS